MPVAGQVGRVVVARDTAELETLREMEADVGIGRIPHHDAGGELLRREFRAHRGVTGERRHHHDAAQVERRAQLPARLQPSGTLGYNKAEVTLGGVDTRGLSSKTMEAQAVRGLYFIGEAVDVTGHLGGFNFQWAWASARAAGAAA